MKPRERPAGEARPYSGKAAPDALEALEDACEEIKAAQLGARNAAINCASFHIGRRIGAGQLDEVKARGALVAAVEHMQHPSENFGRDVGRSSARSRPAAQSLGKSASTKTARSRSTPSWVSRERWRLLRRKSESP